MSIGSISKPKERLLAILLAIVILLFGYAIYIHGSKITGPFIFGDELEYFSYARDIFTGSDLSNHTQYGILYPALASLFFHLGDVERVYYFLRLFNIALFLSSAIPAFLLVRAWFPNSVMLFLFPIFTVIVPFSGFVYLIWADPLYYTLFLWTAFALLSFYRNPRISGGIVAGILLSLLFHTKPGAGVVVQFAAFLSLMTLLAVAPSGKRKDLIIPILVLLISCTLLTVPWMMRNLNLGVGLFGYQTLSHELASTIAEFGYLHLVKNTVLSIFYQLAYVFIGTWGLLGVLFLIPMKCWRTLLKTDFILIVFALLCITGLILLSAFVMSTNHFLRHWMPNGRYLSVMFSFLILLLMGLIARMPNDSNKIRLTLITITLIIVTVLATPLRMMMPLSFVNNTELALPTWIIDKGLVIWRGRYDSAIYERIILAVTYGGIGLGLIWVSRWKRVFVFCFSLVLACSFVATLAEHKFIGILGESQAGLNNVVKFFQQKQLGEKDIPFDCELKTDNISFITRFWMASEKFRYLTQSKAVNSRENSTEEKFFITTKRLPLPVIFQSKELCVYRTHLEELNLE